MLMPRRRASLAVAALVGFASACSTDSSITSLKTPGAASENQSEGRGVFQRYTAIGTSVSMGVQSAGVNDSLQATSWPAQLAAMGGRTLAQPLISKPGCRAPLAFPLASGLRISGEPALAPNAALACSPLDAGVRLPVDNVAINGALTRDALLTTPELSTDALYSRVLQPGHTQVSTMMENDPKLVSVELGANEILGAQTGIAIPAVNGSIFPPNLWAPLYDQVLDAVGATTKMAVLVGLPSNIANLPALRSGNDLWLDRLEFAAVNIAIQADCNASPNQIFLPLAIGTALQAAAQLAALHQGPLPFSCTGSANPAQADFILTPAELGIVNTVIAAMNAHIQSEAATRGYAYFSLGALYDQPGLKAPFSLSVLLQSPVPFGPYFSLDGVHPSALGSHVLAVAAANALNATYKFGIEQ
jgi:hypothetical protein